MNRRHFMKSTLLAFAALGMGAPALLAKGAWAHHGQTVVNRILVNNMLLGGADLRYLFAPAPNHATAPAYFQARRNLFTQASDGSNANYLNYDQLYADQYLETTFGSETFGIHRTAGWLKQEFDQGRVAIVSNVFGSLNRRHDHSQLIVHTGKTDIGQFETDSDGWGGRLAAAVDQLAPPDPSLFADDWKAVAMSTNVPVFCNSADPSNRLSETIHAKDARNIALPGPAGSVTSERSILARALRSYYVARGSEVATDMPPDWVYQRYFQQEKAFRDFGDTFNAHLSFVVPNRPVQIQDLTQGALFSNSFGRQLANLYDCLWCADILGMRVAYLDRGGWDTHSSQQGAIERGLSDLFSLSGGMDTLNQAIAAIPSARDRVVFTFNSDFGRQLAGNGDRGTDHGRGSYSVVYGRQVNGGLYGELFPEREINPDPNDSSGRTPYEIPGRDILGQTALERVMGAIADWVEPGAGDLVFPDRATAALEPGVTLSLFPNVVG